MLLRKLVVVGLVGFVSLAANIATAEDAVGPNAAYVGAASVSFADPNDAFPDRFQINTSHEGGGRFANLTPAEPSERAPNGDRRYQVELVAHAGSGFDVAFAQRGGVGFNDEGDINRQSRGSEVRLGRGLARMPHDRGSPAPRWYIFAASEDQALIWRPGGSNAFGLSGPSFALQDRVEIGDRQAGLTYEAHGWQASLAYVEREIKVRASGRNFNQDESFTGVTLTMRH
jgi:hypothetical protein